MPAVRKGVEMRRRVWGIGAAILAILAVAFVIWGPTLKGGDKAVYRTDTVQRGDVRVLVSATGTLNAVTTVQVGSQVSGTIQALNADFNDRVRKGQVLAQLDPTFLRAQVAQSQADLDRASVQVRQAERDYDRQFPLRDQGLASQSEIDAVETALDAARAGQKSAEAALDRAKTNLRYATIASPIDGVVISRDVDVGQTVAASLSAPTLYTIANDLTQMQLEASVDEADIGLVEMGQKVSFTVDAYPDRNFDGAVHQIRLSPQTVQNVVSYTVIVRVENTDLKLLPGMTANATFLVDSAENTLRVPSAALRFRPAGAGAPHPPRDAAHAAAGGAMSDGAPGGLNRGRRGGAVWVLGEDEKLRRIRVVPGLSDGTFTAVTSDSLMEGMQVVVSSNRPQASADQGTVNPFAPGGMSRGGRR